MPNQPTPVTMQVILRAASGQAPDAHAPVTAATLHQFQPDASAAEATRQHFQQAGFEVGDVVGTSFSITAAAATYQQFFGTEVHLDSAGTSLVSGDGTARRELPLNDLPAVLQPHVAAVTLSEPLDFGPASY
ncbi:hypothetical protein ACI3L1_08265 [Deinococcus sp. SM5_A1]|uniref:hypothetical protein n=1 Tax=Deinococcus sp. SM5_A1 TaxID=3379094 RepID=UPI00385B0D54